MKYTLQNIVKILHPLWIIPVVTGFILPLLLPWISFFLRSSPWLVLRLETLDSVWMWTVISVWKRGLQEWRRNLVCTSCESRFPNPLHHWGHWVFLWKSHGVPDNWWLMVMMHCSGSLLMTLSCMVLRRHFFSCLWFLELEQGFRARSFWWSGGRWDCRVCC